MNVSIRSAREADAPAILAIYGPYVRDTAVSFECRTPSLPEFAGRIRDISADYPYLVCLRGEEIAGYAYAHRQMEREAYQWNAELSVYLAQGCFRRGIGRALCGALLEILRLQNVRNVYGGVTVPNENSERLHEALGFRRLGTYRATGYKCGAWHDVAWFEKQIAPYTPDPEPFRSIRDVPAEAMAEILDRAGASCRP